MRTMAKEFFREKMIIGLSTSMFIVNIKGTVAMCTYTSPLVIHQLHFLPGNLNKVLALHVEDTKKLRGRYRNFSTGRQQHFNRELLQVLQSLRVSDS